MTTDEYRTEWLDAGPLTDLRENRVKVIQGGDHPIAVLVEGETLSAVDNRCPHMGFPLHRGTLKNGVLTCHWHQARFDACSGCAFDVWADDIPGHEVRVADERVYVNPQPRHAFDEAHHRTRLHRGMERNTGVIIGKALAAMRDIGVSDRALLGLLVGFACERGNGWGGLTNAGLAAGLLDHLLDATRHHLLFVVARRLAGPLGDAPVRRHLQAIAPNHHDVGTLLIRLREFTRQRHRDGFEITLRTLMGSGSMGMVSSALATASGDRPFADQGHVLDFVNKGIELVGALDDGYADAVLPLLADDVVGSRGGEEMASWQHPHDLIGALSDVEGRLEGMMATARREEWIPETGFTDTLLGEDPMVILRAIEDALSAGAAPHRIGQWVAHAAALRLARFAASNESGDWFNPQHTFNYANAVHQVLRRGEEPLVVRHLFHAALAVFLDRFLNVPPARMPGDTLTGLSTEPEALLASLLNALDQKSDPEQAIRLAVQYHRLGHPRQGLYDTLVFATLREDLNFHWLQCVEAGIQQIEVWGQAREAEDILVGVVRNLAAACPTRRQQLEPSLVALRLQRGEVMHEEA